jgi:dihydrofolate reductase
MINCIVATDQNGGIGYNGSMPWPHLKGDMAWFKTVTTGNVVIMGSVTWKSLGCKPLPNRVNIILSRKNDYCNADSSVHTLNDPDTALAFCANEYPDKEIFIMGGGVIYTTYLDIVDRFYVTEIDTSYQCDAHFDIRYVKDNFTKVKEHAKFNEPISYTIKEYNL